MCRSLPEIVLPLTISDGNEYLVFRLHGRWDIFWILVGALISIGMFVFLFAVKLPTLESLDPVGEAIVETQTMAGPSNLVESGEKRRRIQPPRRVKQASASLSKNETTYAQPPAGGSIHSTPSLGGAADFSGD